MPIRWHRTVSRGGNKQNTEKSGLHFWNSFLETRSLIGVPNGISETSGTLASTHTLTDSCVKVFIHSCPSATVLGIGQLKMKNTQPFPGCSPQHTVKDQDTGSWGRAEEALMLQTGDRGWGDGKPPGDQAATKSRNPDLSWVSLSLPRNNYS